MPTPDSSSDYDVSERLIAIARFFGVGEITARWKIIRFQRWWRRLRQDLAPASRRFDRQICQSCGALQAESQPTCAACGERIGSRVGAALRGLGLSIPTALSVSSALGIVMVAIYARMMLARPGHGYLDWDIPTLLEFGGHDPAAVHAGQWWRLGTAMFLHIGLVHLGFNLLALAQIGPAVEDVFGRGRMLFFFLVTGVVANVGSELFGLHAVSAGASGAIMGLIGVAAGWGHRSGTITGKNLRNAMLKWAAYTMVFGVFVHADNAAHGVGFASGALLGWAYNPFRLEASKRGHANAFMGAGGALATAALAFLCLAPPASSRALGAQAAAEEEARANLDERGYDDDADDATAIYAKLGPACALFDGGKKDEAVAKLRAEMPEVVVPDPEVARKHVEELCQARAILASLCERLEKQGVDALLDPMAVAPDPQIRAQVEEGYRRMCGQLKGR